MNILVTGDRSWADYGMIYSRLADYQRAQPDEYPTGYIKVIHGAARGADRLAGYAAKSLAMSLVEYPAEWVRLGRAAGPIRNQLMLDKEDVNVVLAFHDDIASSKGTADMISRAKKKGIKVYLFSHEHPEGVVQ